MAPKKRLHELARELDIPTDRLIDIAMRMGIRFTSNFNAVEPEHEERLKIAVLGEIRKKTKPIVKIVRTAKQIADEKAEESAVEEKEEPKVKLIKRKPAKKTEEVVEEVEVAEQVEKPAEEEAADDEDKKDKEDTGQDKKPEEANPEKKVAEKVEVSVKKEEKKQEKVAIKPAKKEESQKTSKVDRKPKYKEEKEKPFTDTRKDKPATEKVAKEQKKETKEVTPAAAVPSGKKGKQVGGSSETRGNLARFEDKYKDAQKRRKKKKSKSDKRTAAKEAQETKTVTPGKKRQKKPTGANVDHIMINEGMNVKDLAEKLGVMAKDIIQKLFLEKGIMANINQVLDLETATEIAEGYGVTVEEVSFEEEIALEEELKFEGDPIDRAPVVTIMGHVDHGKTTLLDYIRKTRVAEGEHGGITQHIGAYRVGHKNNPIVFLDTPGHAAFTKLRARGAEVTDVIILIVAADDGVMPQTVESIQHAKASGVPMIVAVTKTDKPQANIDKVKQGLSQEDVLVEDWGGETVCVPVSGKTGDGIDDLLEMILLVSEMQDLKAYPDIKGMGSVIEAKLDRARGPVATVLIQNGSLKVGDFFIAGITMGKIKAMFDDTGKKIIKAGPSTPVEILGFNEVPESGDQFQIVDDESKARQMITYRHEKVKEAQMSRGAKLSLDDLFSKIEQGDVAELPLIIKGDVKGSVEALSDALEKLSTDKVKVKIMLSQPGAITESDVLLATASSSIIIGFNVRAQKGATAIAEKEAVEIRTYNVIYEAIKDVKDAMRGMLAPTIREKIIGKAEIRQVFKVPKIGMVAGTYVIDGFMQRKAGARLIRDDIVIWEGKVSSLRRFKDDVREVKQGFECGIGLDGQNDLRENDIIEMFVKEEIAAEL